MKRQATLIVLSFISCIVLAQHINFKSVPVDGNVSTFVQKLQEEGFELKKKEEDLAMLTGNFAGQNDTHIFVVGTKKTHTVWQVCVFFHEKTNFFELKSEYLRFKTQLKLKYGEPRSYEYFREPYKLGDGYELQALKLDKCVYKSYYDAPGGIVSCCITKTCEVQIIYEDEKNSDIMEQERNELINQDL